MHGDPFYQFVTICFVKFWTDIFLQDIMKLSEWLKKEGLTHDDFLVYLQNKHKRLTGIHKSSGIKGELGIENATHT